VTKRDLQSYVFKVRLSVNVRWIERRGYLGFTL